MYFDDVTDGSWNAVKYIYDRITKQEIIEKLTKEICIYQKNILSGINEY
jgi:hypothetical protein